MTAVVMTSALINDCLTATVATTAVGAIGIDAPGWWTSRPAIARARAVGTAGAVQKSGDAKSAVCGGSGAFGVTGAGGAGFAGVRAATTVPCGRGARFGLGGPTASVGADAATATATGCVAVTGC